MYLSPHQSQVNRGHLQPDGQQRELLFAMDMDLLRLRQRVGESDSAVVGLTGSYHNLLRMWADA